MTGIALAFFFGIVIGLLFGLWVGGRAVLYKMRHDEHKGVDANYEKRKEKYL